MNCIKYRKFCHFLGRESSEVRVCVCVCVYLIKPQTNQHVREINRYEKPCIATARCACISTDLVRFTDQNMATVVMTARHQFSRIVQYK